MITKNELLADLANLKAKLYSMELPAPLEYHVPTVKALEIIDRNLTSIEKQIKKLYQEPTERQVNAHIRRKEAIYSNLF